MMTKRRTLDLRPCKEAARRLLPMGHPLREALLREEDAVPWDAGIEKVAMYVVLAHSMRRTG